MTFDKLKSYNEIFENYLEKGISEPAPKKTPYLTHYLAQISKVNQVVLVKEPGEPRASWKLGKILTLDHRSAVATVLVDKVHLTRSINFLYPLELS